MNTTTGQPGLTAAIRLAAGAAVFCLIGGLVGCGGGSSAAASAQQFNIQGTIAGLANGQSVVLEVNGTRPLTVTSDGVFGFTHAVSAGDTYDVTVSAQPMGAVCTVTNGAGAGATADIINVAITCSVDAFTVSGQLSGLPAGTQVVLENNGADALTLTGNGNFTFATPVAFNGSYAITVSTQPASATCSVTGSTGAGVTGDVSGVSVGCSASTYPIGGTLSGLIGGARVTLQDNGADALTLGANGRFTFPGQIAAGGSYTVTVGTQPTGQTCTVSNGQNNELDSDITNVAVTCSASTFTIGGGISGLASGDQVTLDNNSADPVTVTANGSFQFDVPVAYGGSSDVTVGTQPVGQMCLVANGAQANVSSNITNVTVSCITNRYTTPGTYSFLVPDGASSLQIVATGGGGGGGGASGMVYPANAGGVGAVVASTLSVTPGQILSLVVGGGGGAGSNGPGTGPSYTCGGGGGGGGATSVDAGETDQMIAGAGGGGGSCVGNASGGNAGGANGAGGAGGRGNSSMPAAGGANGIGGAGAQNIEDGIAGGDGNGGPGGSGGGNGPGIFGGTGGSGTGSGSGAPTPGDDSAGGGGGFGGGGSGSEGSGGGAGGSTGPSGTAYTNANNGGSQAGVGSDGSIVITLQ